MTRWWVLALLSCSAPMPTNPAPVIDSLQMPATAALDATGKATLEGMLQFHDDDDTVATVVTRVPATNQSTTGTIPPASIGLVSITIVLAGTKGTTVDYEITLVDKSGLSSAPAKRSVMFN